MARLRRETSRRDATCSPWWCVQIRLDTPRRTRRNLTSSSSVVALPNERTKHLTRPSIPRPDAQVPEGAEDSLDALQHASERLEADATALRREILHGALRVLESNDEADDAADREKHERRVATVAALADLAPPRSPEDPPDETPDDDDHMTTFGVVASPGRETRREDAAIASRAATLEAESDRLRTLTVAAGVADAFARAEASIRDAEAALARGEYEIAAAALAATRDALATRHRAVTSPGVDSSSAISDSSVGHGLRRRPTVHRRRDSSRRRRRLRASFSIVTTTAARVGIRTVGPWRRAAAAKELARRWTTLNSIDVCGKAGRDEAAAVARRAGESWGDAWSERAAHDARVLAEGLERSIDAIATCGGSFRRDRGRSSKFRRRRVAPSGNAVIRRWFSTDNSGSSSRRDLDDVDDDDGVRSGVNESRLDEECVSALVGAEGAAQALGLVPPPPHVGPVESAAYDATGRNARDTSPPFSPPRATSSEPHETMRALGRSGATTRAGTGWAPGDGDGGGSGWRPGIGGAGPGSATSACAVRVEEGADFWTANGAR